jgi:hypothetical protein
MNAKDSLGAKLLADIDKEFINIIGPIGSMIIEDTRLLWQKKAWKGPSALRHYVNVLASNIDDEDEKNAFIKTTSKLAMTATASRKQL